MGFLERSKEAVNPLEFVKPNQDGKVTESPLVFMDKNLNGRFNYAILKTTENGKYIRGNQLFYSLNGVEVYTDLNNIIFVDEANKTLFIRSYDAVIHEIAPKDPEQTQYIILFTDKSYDEYENEIPLKWEAYIGRLNAYEAIKSNIYYIDPDKSLILADNVALKDSLSVREFVEYLVNADYVEDEIDFDDYI